MIKKIAFVMNLLLLAGLGYYASQNKIVDDLSIVFLYFLPLAVILANIIFLASSLGKDPAGNTLTKGISIISNFLLLANVIYLINENGVPYELQDISFCILILLVATVNLYLIIIYPNFIKIKEGFVYSGKFTKKIYFSRFITKIRQIIINNKILVTIILVSVFSLYFFGVRPSQIKKECSMTMRTTDGVYHYRANSTDEEYKICLRKHGIGD